ncbi:hypothetical protein LPW41_01135 [Microbacterium sp. JC 701]|uniref:hypothetical protein n=1 Tax=Microbacterium sp. JC 701 TaxID=2897389 RepID=UPI001E344D9E|nr:hypothetical protein [Microbacterium sp. JC 701]MCD2168294.1 hypothetical protein [Microbacterium sp. JC 701]
MPLFIDLAGVSRLAGVRRSVASMWRTRFNDGPDAFPAPVFEEEGRPQFSAPDVAEWLARTDHGKNPHAAADVASVAAPRGLSFSDAQAVAELEALVALSHFTEGLDGSTGADIARFAREVDSSDDFLRREIEEHARRGSPWVEYALSLTDSVYSPSAAIQLIAGRSSSVGRATASAGALAPEAKALVVEMVRMLAHEDSVVRLDPHDASLSSMLAQKLGDGVSLSLPPDVPARRLKRRLLVDGHTLIDDATLPAVIVTRVPATRGADVSSMLHIAEEVALSLRAADSAVVVGPSRALVDELPRSEERERADILRSGWVRGIVRLGEGLVPSASRESLSLWVLGNPAGAPAIADRFTATADLSAVSLTPAARFDMVSDIAAAMGAARDVQARQFRFAGLVPTTSLQARSESLVTSSARRVKRSPSTGAEVAARLDIAGDSIRADFVPVEIDPSPHDVPRPAPVSDLIRNRHLRVVSGTRVRSELFGSDGLVVVCVSDLDDPSTIGGARIDQLTFASEHSRASLTQPGDIVFRTSPTAAAWVDRDGSKVVAYPARVLRINKKDPGGLVSEVVAADIFDAMTGPGAWKRWTFRRVDHRSAAPLARALNTIAEARANLEARSARLNEYAALLVTAATSGAVALVDAPDDENP